MSIVSSVFFPSVNSMLESSDNLFSSRSKKIKYIRGDNNEVPDYLNEMFGFNSSLSPEIKYKNKDATYGRKDNSEMNVNNKTTNTSKYIIYLIGNFNTTNNNSNNSESNSPVKTLKADEKMKSKFNCKESEKSKMSKIL